MLPYAEMEIVVGKEMVQLKEAAINYTVGFTEITELRNVKKIIVRVTVYSDTGVGVSQEEK